METVNKPSKEMIDHFNKRTNYHIELVGKNIEKLSSFYKFDSIELEKRKKTHDSSKFDKLEFIPYVYLSWWHKEKNKGRKYLYPNGMKEKVRDAIKLHKKRNSHHPDYFGENLKKMSRLDIVEMICDHSAVCQEYKTKLEDWTKNHTLKRKWTPNQKKWIIEFVEALK